MPLHSKTPSSLVSFKSRPVYLSGTGLPRLSWKRGCWTIVIVVVLASIKWVRHPLPQQSFGRSQTRNDEAHRMNTVHMILFVCVIASVLHYCFSSLLLLVSHRKGIWLVKTCHLSWKNYLWNNWEKKIGDSLLNPSGHRKWPLILVCAY